MLNDDTARHILQTYGEAWMEQDIPKILSIFHQDGIYAERVLQQPFRGHEEIAAYWKKKVVEEQSAIQFKVLHFYIAGDTLIAEWEASFDSNIEHARIHMREVAILEIEDGRIRSLREYWQSEKRPHHEPTLRD